MKARALLYAATAAVLGYVLAVACTDAPLHDYCTGIPAGGCPGLDGSNCLDPTCEAIYSNDLECKWTFVTKCPNYKAPKDGGPADGARDGPPGDARGEGRAPDAHAHARDAGFVLPDGAAGVLDCPMLELPDCDVASAAECPPQANCCGCQDLWTCVDPDAGWNLWGECDDGGALVPAEYP